MTSTRVCPASDIIGETVYNRQGENLGKIEDLAIDDDSGRVAYAVLSFGGFLGMGDKHFAIPWSSLEKNRSDDTLILDANKELLKNAPGFDKDNWPDFSDRTWGTRIHQYYGRRAYWEE
jgi:sporulation protein YlmC with PRC-barrel domain